MYYWATYAEVVYKLTDICSYLSLNLYKTEFFTFSKSHILELSLYLLKNINNSRKNCTSNKTFVFFIYLFT